MKPNFKHLSFEIIVNHFSFGYVLRGMAVDKEDPEAAVCWAISIDSKKRWHKSKKKIMRMIRRRIKNHYRYKL